MWARETREVLLLLLLLSRFSRVRLCATPETAAHQAPLSLGFSRQEHWMGCHFLLQRMKVKSESEAAQSCPTLSDPVDCSPPCSSHGIFQARVLEWGAIAFSSCDTNSAEFQSLSSSHDITSVPATSTARLEGEICLFSIGIQDPIGGWWWIVIYIFNY